MINTKYVGEGYIAIIKENEDNYFYAMKCGDSLYCSLLISIYKKGGKKDKGDYIGTYSKNWTEETNLNTINNFIKNILEDVEYRKEYLIEGEDFLGIINYSNEDGVNKKCREAINKFYKKKSSKRKFKDFAEIKTYGVDKFSKMKLDKIKEHVRIQDIERARSTFEDEKQILACLRWCCRGLYINDAIRKVKTDLEITENNKTKYKR